MAIPSLASYALAGVRHCEMSRHEWLFDVSLRVARKFMRELRDLEDADLQEYDLQEYDLQEYTRIKKRVCRIAWTETHAARVRQILSVAERSDVVAAVLAHIRQNVDASDSALMGDTVIQALQGARKNRKRILAFMFDRKKVCVEWHRRGAWFWTLDIRNAKNAGALMHILANKNIADVLAFWDRLGIFNDPYPFPGFQGKTSAKRTYRGAPAMWRVWLLDHFDAVTKK